MHPLRARQRLFLDLAVNALLVALGLLVALTAAMPIGRASANGGAAEIFRGRAGSYEIVVAILPEKPVVGTVHFSVTLRDIRTSEPVTDAEVDIVAHDPSGQPMYQARALNTPGSPQRYEANISFESPGTWTLAVAVQSERLGSGEVTVPLEVEERAIGPGQVGSVVWLVVVAVLVGGAVYVWHSSRRAQRAAGR